MVLVFFFFNLHHEVNDIFVFLSNVNINFSMDLPICSGCHKTIEDEECVQACEKDWHSSCFRYYAQQCIYIFPPCVYF